MFEIFLEKDIEGGFIVSKILFGWFFDSFWIFNGLFFIKTSFIRERRWIFWSIAWSLIESFYNKIISNFEEGFNLLREDLYCFFGYSW